MKHYQELCNLKKPPKQQCCRFLICLQYSLESFEIYFHVDRCIFPPYIYNWRYDDLHTHNTSLSKETVILHDSKRHIVISCLYILCQEKRKANCVTLAASLQIILFVTPWLQEDRTNRWMWLFLSCAFLSKCLTSTCQSSIKAVTPVPIHGHGLTHCYMWSCEVSQQLKTLHCSKSKESQLEVCLNHMLTSKHFKVCSLHVWSGLKWNTRILHLYLKNVLLSQEL